MAVITSSVLHPGIHSCLAWQFCCSFRFADVRLPPAVTQTVRVGSYADALRVSAASAAGDPMGAEMGRAKGEQGASRQPRRSVEATVFSKECFVEWKCFFPLYGAVPVVVIAARWMFRRTA